LPIRNANLIKTMAITISVGARKMLDEALKDTFPASDPVSVEQPTTSGRVCRSRPQLGLLDSHEGLGEREPFGGGEEIRHIGG